ncbi:hypothetical protein II898_05000, partial [bacterium]|nr:hypothetical protein [bacterium]
MKKIRILGLLLASCFFFACNGITTDDNNISYKINSEKATLSFSVNSLERIVRPTAVDFTKAEVLYRKTAETGTAADYKELKTWTVKTISGGAGTT